MNNTPPFSYPGIGRCIYCGSTADLRDEHIIPRSLGGVHIFRDASCGVCADITSKFERTVSRTIFGDARITHGMPTRRRRDRPTKIKAKVTIAGTQQERSILVSDYPAAPVALPVLPRAGLLDGRAPSVEIPDVRFRFLAPQAKDHDARMERLRSQGIESLSHPMRFEANSFLRMLAKIAYGVAIVEYGPDTFRSWLPDLILGRESTLGYVIGSSEGSIDVPSPRETDVHAFSAGVLKARATRVADDAEVVHHYVWSQVELFRYLKPNLIYQVLVGDPSPELVGKVFAHDDSTPITL